MNVEGREWGGRCSCVVRVHMMTVLMGYKGGWAGKEREGERMKRCVPQAQRLSRRFYIGSKKKKACNREPTTQSINQAKTTTTKKETKPKHNYTYGVNVSYSACCLEKNRKPD